MNKGNSRTKLTRGTRRRSSPTLQRYLLMSFLPFFLGALVINIFLFELIDLFPNLVRYITSGASVTSIAKIILYYIPTTIGYGLPIALLFGTSYTLGTMYARNELIAVFSSGLALHRFVIPILLIAALTSIGFFYFQDRVVFKTYKIKAGLTRQALRSDQSYNNNLVTVLSRNGRFIYYARSYTDATKTLNNLILIERDNKGQVIAHTEAASAVWQNGRWMLRSVRRISLDKNAVIQGDNQLKFWLDQNIPTYTAAELTESPDSFRIQNPDVREMSIADIDDYSKFLKSIGLSTAELSAERYKRYSFAFAPFIVVFLSASLGGYFRRSVLLLSILSSIAIAATFYIMQMLSSLLTTSDVLTPIVGAWFPIVFFAILGTLLFRYART